jgi:hypothetical protein
MEAALAVRGTPIAAAGPDELERAWEAAKGAARREPRP